MGPRAGFENGMAGGCTPLRGVDVVDVKIKLRADPSPPPDARPNGPISRGAWHSVCLSPARAPMPRACARTRLRFVLVVYVPSKLVQEETIKSVTSFIAC